MVRSGSQIITQSTQPSVALFCPCTSVLQPDTTLLLKQVMAMPDHPFNSQAGS
jgi:hypothetical protein